VKDTLGLTELSPTESEAFRLGHPGPTIPRERIFDAGPVQFKGIKWQVMVASTNDRIYKIALQHAASSPASADRIFNEMKSYFTSLIGKPSESSARPKQYIIWDAAEGNTVLDRADLISGQTVVDWYLTSKIITEQ
jgi:hypothetical protein